MNKTEEFKFWVDYIPEYLHFFMEKHPIFKESLDFSIESFSFLEKYLIENIVIEQLKKDGFFHEKIAIYIGETFIRNMEQGYWDIEFKEKYIYSGIPVIRMKSRKGMENCPHYLVINVIKKKRGDFLITMFNKMKKYDDKS